MELRTATHHEHNTEEQDGHGKPAGDSRKAGAPAGQDERHSRTAARPPQTPENPQVNTKAHPHDRPTSGIQPRRFQRNPAQNTEPHPNQRRSTAPPNDCRAAREKQQDSKARKIAQDFSAAPEKKRTKKTASAGFAAQQEKRKDCTSPNRSYDYLPPKTDHKRPKNAKASFFRARPTSAGAPRQPRARGGDESVIYLSHVPGKKA